MSDNKNDIAGTVFELSAMIDYQASAVVSRTIIKKPTGTTTVFAFDKGEGLSEHTAPFDAMVYIADGEAGVTISGRSNLLKAGDMIVMPAGEPHSLKAVEKFKMLLVMIKS